ncbi:hypothetical protein [Parabacteroides pacaensis]|uniref:hypothetical protein n=1 Tax=Parabacteroides pacaensis TaxID=2086575 RepID=UPI00131CCA74|nr:hypothetical protein [Parabacteroides pacaensis]
MKPILRKYLKWVLPVIFIGYFGIVSLFEHTHIVNGVVVVHSHPFKSLPEGAAHHHTANQLQLFYFLSHFSAGEGCVYSLALSLSLVLLVRYSVPLISSGFISRIRDAISLRAPPVI